MILAPHIGFCSNPSGVRVSFLFVCLPRSYLVDFLRLLGCIPILLPALRRDIEELATNGRHSRGPASHGALTYPPCRFLRHIPKKGHAKKRGDVERRLKEKKNKRSRVRRRGTPGTRKAPGLAGGVSNSGHQLSHLAPRLARTSAGESSIH